MQNKDDASLHIQLSHFNNWSCLPNFLCRNLHD